jgi:Uma2 family endonuclease
MAYLLEKPTEQRFTHIGVTWEQFKLIEAGFSDSPGIRLFYYESEVEILAISPEHEITSRLIGILLAVFFEEMEIEFSPTGSFTQEKPGIVSAQADESYFLGNNTSTIPDLSIEVVITSGGVNKLARYRALGVPEVWFWEDGLFSLYRLRDHGYDRIYRSEIPALMSLDLALLTGCVLMAQTSRMEAMRTFRQAIQQTK